MKRQIFLIGVLLALVAVAVVQPALAQNVTWRAEYYNNATLTGSPTVVRNESSLNINWGLGSPDPSIPVDNFSARFAADIPFSPGTYRFYARADDNVRVTFNFSLTPVIDTFANPAVGQIVSGDVTVTEAGTYHVQVDYQENTDQAYIDVSFANLATNPNPPNFAQPTQVPVTLGPWIVQYYANNSLSGEPAAIQSVPGVSVDFGYGSPLPNIPADNFSARWSSTQNLAGGAYQLFVQADDGVRVYVNGTLVVNQWSGYTGQTNIVNLNLPAGQNSFVVEYQEFTERAFIDFRLTQTTAAPTPAPTTPTGATATVTAYRLNVRSSPDASTNNVITRVNRFEQYPVVARLANNAWFQLNVGGTLGWVSGSFVSVTNIGSVPEVDPDRGGGGSDPSPSAFLVTATPYTVNIRSGPGTQYGRIARLPAGQTARVVGRTSDNNWWQVDYQGINGWVSAQYGILQQGANPAQIPVTG